MGGNGSGNGSGNGNGGGNGSGGGGGSGNGNGGGSGNGGGVQAPHPLYPTSSLLRANHTKRVAEAKRAAATATGTGSGSGANGGSDSGNRSGSGSRSGGGSGANNGSGGVGVGTVGTSDSAALAAKPSKKARVAAALRHRSLFLLAPGNPFRRLLVAVVQSKWFELVSLIVILVNTAFMAAQDPLQPPDVGRNRLLEEAEIVFNALLSG
jgi:hypothetical protein